VRRRHCRQRSRAWHGHRSFVSAPRFHLHACLPAHLHYCLHTGSGTRTRRIGNGNGNIATSTPPTKPRLGTTYSPVVLPIEHQRSQYMTRSTSILLFPVLSQFLHLSPLVSPSLNVHACTTTNQWCHHPCMCLTARLPHPSETHSSRLQGHDSSGNSPSSDPLLRLLLFLPSTAPPFLLVPKASRLWTR
jgi:hypothetical protein